MKKIIIIMVLAISALTLTQSAYAASFALEAGYTYYFKYTNWEVITDAAGSTSGVPNEIKGIYKVTTVQRAPAEIIGGIPIIDFSQLDTAWWTAGDNGEYLDGTFTLSLNSVGAGGVADWDADLDLWLDTADVNASSVALGLATAGGADGDELLAALESVTYTTQPLVDADGLGPNIDIQASASLKFGTNNTGIDWFTNPDGSQFGLASNVYIQSGTVWDFFSQDPLTGTAPVPEPASLVLLGAGLVGGYLRKRKSI